jgi:hypothetical protein
MEITEATAQKLIGILEKVDIGARSAPDTRRGGSGGNDKASKAFGEALGIAEKNTGTFGAMVNQAGGTYAGAVSTFAKSLDKVPGVSMVADAMSGMLIYADETQQVFQSLSKVGAGFNGNLAELRMGAAETRLTLGDFASMVGANSEALAGFAGGVQGGVKRFRQLSNAMFSGDRPVIDGFQRLGMTLNESNEFILKNMEIQQRSSKMRGPGGDEEMLAASLRMAESLDIMSKLSGKQLDQMQEDILREQSQGRVNAALRQMGPESQKAFSELQVGLANAGDGAKAYAKDILTYGAPVGKAAIAFAASNHKAARSIDAAIGDVRKGSGDAAKKMGQQATAQVAEFAGSAQGLTLARLGGLGSIFDAQEKNLEQTDTLINQINAHQEKVLANTGESLSYTQAYAQMLKQQVEIQKTQTSGTGEGTEISNVLNKSQQEIANQSSRIAKQLASNLDSNDTLIKGAQAFTAKFIETLNSITGTIASGIDAGIPGDTQENQRNQVSEEDRANLDLVKAFENGSVSVEAKNKALDDLAAAGIIHKNGLIVQTPTIDDNGNVVNDPVTSEEENLKRPKSRNALGGGMSSGEASLVGEFGPETFVAGMDGAIIPNMKAMLNRMPDIAKTMQDEMAMMGAPMSKVAQEASAQMQNSTSVEQKLDILNQTMLQLVNINSVQARTGEKQLKGLRHSGNLMGGLGRA